jgi:surfeit locus 1 family protein
MLSKQVTFGKLVIRFNGLIAACLLLAIGSLIRLGIWQLERAGEKIELQSDFQRMEQMTPSAMETVPLAGHAIDAVQLQNRQVSLRGQYLNDRSLFLIYRTYKNQIGYEIVTPFELAAREEIVLVSRGWTGAASYETLSASITPVQGEQTLLGQIHVPRAAETKRTTQVREVKWPLLLRYLNIQALQPLFTKPLFPYVVRLNAGQKGVLVRYWPAVKADTSRHFSYALQWFALAITLAVVSFILSSNILNLLGSRADNTNRRFLKR